MENQTAGDILGWIYVYVNLLPLIVPLFKLFGTVIKIFCDLIAGMQFVSAYNLFTLFQLHICQVCGSFQCPYCAYYNAATRIVMTSSFWTLIASLAVVYFAVSTMSGNRRGGVYWSVARLLRLTAHRHSARNSKSPTAASDLSGRDYGNEMSKRRNQLMYTILSYFQDGE